MSWIDEFRAAYDAVPSQDNEGYVPDRAGFKCGFSSAWHLQQQKIYVLEEELKWRRGVHGVSGEVDELRIALTMITNIAGEMLAKTKKT